MIVKLLLLNDLVKILIKHPNSNDVAWAKL